MRGEKRSMIPRSILVLGLSLVLATTALPRPQSPQQQQQQEQERERERKAEQERQRQAQQERQREAEQERRREAQQERQREAEQERQRAQQEHQREAEQERQREAQQERQRQGRQEQQQSSRQPNNSYSPAQPNNSNTGATHPYSQGSGANSSGLSSGRGSSTTFTPRTYTPGSSSSSAGSPSVSTGPKVYVPHSASSSVTRPDGSTNSRRPDISKAGPVGPRIGGPASTVPAGKPAATPPAYSVTTTAVASKTAKGDSILTTAGSASVLHQVNAARTRLAGVNKHSLPAGQVTTHPDGSLTVTSAAGHVYNVRSNGTLASFKKDGKVVSFTPNGRVGSIHSKSMDVTTNAHGQRTVVVRRADKSLVVSTGPHSGYVQKTVAAPNGRILIQRTYLVNNLHVTRVYDTYVYNGVTLPHYVPAFYYAPEFYGWAYYPWDAPIAYRWGWADSPWVGYYSGYFAPFPVYASPAYWLTDYIFSETLAEAYQNIRERQAAREAQAAGAEEAGDRPDADDEVQAQQDTPITPELKQAIAEEVQQQLAYENAAAAKQDGAAAVDSLPQVLVANHLFVVGQALNVATTDAAVCALSPGDVLKLTDTPGDGAQAAELFVAASRQSDCPAGTQVTVALQDLQEMQDNFRTALSAGLQGLHDGQGQNGLPPAPRSAIAPPPRPAVNVTADNTVLESALMEAQLDADKAASQATTQAFSPTAPKLAQPAPAATATPKTN